jgi:hypothetical protein
MADESIRRAGKAMKRRGILAAAGAAVAGIVAMQTAQPVAAAVAPVQMETDASANNVIFNHPGIPCVLQAPENFSSPLPDTYPCALAADASLVRTTGYEGLRGNGARNAGIGVVGIGS